jgi:predicted dehydrogenase
MNPRSLRVVLVGCGAMSAEWLRVAARIPALEIVGLVDVRLEAALERQRVFHLNSARVGTDLEAMLRDLHPDALFDVTVPEAHAQNALMAFQYGVHVLGEKPLAHTLDAARRTVAAARDAALTHAVIQNRRFDVNLRRVRDFLESGQLGVLTTLNADLYIGAHFGGFRDTMRHPLLLDMAIHTFDAARLLSGANAVRAYCLEWNPTGSWYAHGSSAVCLFEMSDGSVFNYRGSWCAEGFPTTWEADWRIVGTRGTVRWDGGDHPRASLVRVAGRGVSDGDPDAFHATVTELELPAVGGNARVGGHAGAITDFVEALREGRAPETVSSDNLRSLEMVFAAIQSAESGQPVTIGA